MSERAPDSEPSPPRTEPASVLDALGLVLLSLCVIAGAILKGCP